MRSSARNVAKVCRQIHHDFDLNKQSYARAARASVEQNKSRELCMYMTKDCPNIQNRIQGDRESKQRDSTRQE